MKVSSLKLWGRECTREKNAQQALTAMHPATSRGRAVQLRPLRSKHMPKVNRVQHNKNALLDALEKSLGVVTSACKSVGVDRTTFYNYYNTDPKFRDAVDSIENIALDFAESQLHKQIRDGNVAATIFYLKTKGKKRGYIERSEVQNDGTMKVIWNEVEDARDHD